MAGTHGGDVEHAHHAHIDSSTIDEPSKDWGWHGTFKYGAPIAGWFTAFSLFMMLFGNHEGHVEDVFLIVIGSGLVLALLGHHMKVRSAGRR